MSEIVLVDINKPGAFTPLLSGFKPGENKTFAYGYLAQGYAAGILVAEVYGPFAQIRHLYVAESFRRMQIANTLLSEVTNRLKSGGVQEISACVCLEGEKRIACESLLLLRGFLPEERYGSCSVLMKDLYDALEIKDNVSEDPEHILSAKEQLPEEDCLPESRVYMKNGRALGALLLEESNGGVTVTSMFARDKTMLRNLFREALKLLTKRFNGKAPLTILTEDKEKEGFIKNLLGEKVKAGPETVLYTAALGGEI